jgi:hypothetical protein
MFPPWPCHPRSRYVPEKARSSTGTARRLSNTGRQGMKGEKGGLGSCTRHGSKPGSQNDDELTNSYGGAKVRNSGRENKGQGVAACSCRGGGVVDAGLMKTAALRRSSRRPNLPLLLPQRRPWCGVGVLSVLSSGVALLGSGALGSSRQRRGSRPLVPGR